MCICKYLYTKKYIIFVLTKKENILNLKISKKILKEAVPDEELALSAKCWFP